MGQGPRDPAPSAGGSAGRGTRAKILIVEDEPDLAWLERFNLESEGFEVEVALEGRAALEALDRFRPDVLVLDVMLPRVNGWSVLARAGQLPPEGRPRVILVSALPGVAEQARQEGLDALFLAKPFEMEELIRAVERSLAAG
jgi:DNA-binding response OmpR family regulator